ncbi:MAG: 4Fe-4S binding protein [Lachnospiraceae bacterium]|nr:4Fe-4S binding protein [Lachnospiraceae bacterium]
MAKHLRKLVQAGWGAIQNGWVRGLFAGGKIYTGPLKHVCVPGMNCYSCPMALGSCPIGAMQSVFDGRRRSFSFYVLGFLSAVALFAGRFVCGWLCLFGLIQELLYRIPTPKIKIPEKADRLLRWLKYAVLLVLVVGLPLLYRGPYGEGVPFFCKYLCPVGTLEGGIPLALLNEGVRGALGGLFRWKFLILILCILASVFIYRPFCKYLCPLGAFYALFQKVSLCRLHLDREACVHCGLCAKACGMNVDPSKKPDSTECIRCGECVHVCPKGALSLGIKASSKASEKQENES